MPTDIHLGRNKGEAARSPRVGWLEPSEHRLFVQEAGVLLGADAILRRMFSHDADSYFLLGELDRVEGELTKLAGLADPAAKRIVEFLEQLCHRARAEGVCIYLFAD